MLRFFPFDRVAGNAAYIIGTLAESDLGCMRILSLAKGGSKESKKILPDLTRMLTFDDSESVMNAAGTMGTLVSEPSDGDFCCLLITFANSLDPGHRSGQTKGLIWFQTVQHYDSISERFFLKRLFLEKNAGKKNACRITQHSTASFRCLGQNFFY